MDLVSIASSYLQRSGFRKNAVQPSEETKNVIRGGDLKKLTKKVERIQGELDSIDAEIEQLEAAKVRPSLPTDPPQVNSMKQWFARHGEPGPAPPGYLSSFTKKPKIYGGTNHHRGAPPLSPRGVVCTGVGRASAPRSSCTRVR